MRAKQVVLNPVNHNYAAVLFGAQPNSIAIVGSVAYVALYTVNALAVVDISGGAFDETVLGYIPTASRPSSVVYDATHDQLVVTNDKGVGAQSNKVSSHGAGPAYNTHEDQGTVSLIPLPNFKTLLSMTAQVYQNNHWAPMAPTRSRAGSNATTTRSRSKVASRPR